MNEQEKASSDQNSASDEVQSDLIENSSLMQDSDGDGLANSQSALFGNEPESADTDRDESSYLQSVVLGTGPNNPKKDRHNVQSSSEVDHDIDISRVEQTKELLQGDMKQSLSGDLSSPSLDTQLEPTEPNVTQSPDPKPDIPKRKTERTDQPSIVNLLYHLLTERSGLDLSNAKLSIDQGSGTLYRGTFQKAEMNALTQEQQDLLQKTLENPSYLKGELTITVNSQKIFNVENGELKVDSYGLAGNQQQNKAQGQNQAKVIPSVPTFDAPAAYNRYQQQTQSESTVPATPASIDAYERIAQKALSDGQPREQVKQVLKLDPFHQTLTLGIGPKEASRFTDHLLNSLALQAKTNSLSPIANTDNPVAALESRVKNLESFNQHLSSQVEILSQKLEKLSQSKAFWSHSPGLNQFLGNVRDYAANTWLAARNSLRQKAGEVSLALVGTLALASTERFGEPTRGGNRVIDSGNGKRLSISREGDIKIGLSPQLQPASEYQRLLQSIDPKLPPSLQAKQIATSALKEKFTTPQIQSILSQSPKFKEIASKQGADKALQFVNVTLAAASRQNAIESQPQPQRSGHQQSQHQA